MAYLLDLQPKQPVFALLVGDEMRSIMPENNRVFWHLYFYWTEKTRMTAAKKKKRQRPDSMYLSWEFTLEDIIKNGKWLLVREPESILKVDKLDIWRQLFKEGKK